MEYIENAVWIDPMIATACLAMGITLIYIWLEGRRDLRKWKARMLAEQFAKRNVQSISQETLFNVMVASGALSDRPNLKIVRK